MAKRKRKMTLFDVINTGPSKGLQVRHRVPTYQPVPELPVQKKLAKLFGRRAGGGSDRPLTAAEELEQLRRELAPPPAAAPKSAEPFERVSEDDVPDAEVEAEPAPKRAPRVTTRVLEYQPAPEELHREPAPSMSVSDRVRMLAAEADENESVRSERTPGKPIGERLLGAWGVVSPRLATAGRSVGRATSGGFIQMRTQASRYRELQSRYGVTAITFAAMLLLFGGSFYVGRFLFAHPSSEPRPIANAVDGNTRSDVLDLSNANRSETVANVNTGRSQTQLVNHPQDTNNTASNNGGGMANQPASAAFGGRDQSLNYVIIQSCATRADAEATIEVLAKYNVQATVETGLGFNRTLPFAVVSRQGFSRITNNPELVSFKDSLMRISEKEAGNTIHDAFDPQPFKYKPH